MSHDPYKEFDEFYKDEPIPGESSDSGRRGATSPQSPSWGPQPVTGPQNPYPSPTPPPPPPAPSYGHYAPPPAPYTGGHMPMHYGSAPSPDRQRQAGSLRLNAWISVFLPIISVIYFFAEKGKNPLYDSHLRETMNMGITRMLIGFGAAIFSGGTIGTIFGLVTMVYFVLAILGAVESPNKFLRGEQTRYKGAIPFTRPD